MAGDILPVTLRSRRQPAASQPQLLMYLLMQYVWYCMAPLGGRYEEKKDKEEKKEDEALPVDS